MSARERSRPCGWNGPLGPSADRRRYACDCVCDLKRWPANEEEKIESVTCDHLIRSSRRGEEKKANRDFGEKFSGGQDVNIVRLVKDVYLGAVIRMLVSEVLEK